jgi:uncharacterized protein
MTRMLTLLAALVASPALAAPVEPDVPLVVKEDIKVVFQIDDDDEVDGEDAGLRAVGRLLDVYDADPDISTQDRQVVVVVHGEAGHRVLQDAPYARALGKRRADNPNAELVAALQARGVSVEICANTLKAHGWTREDLLPGVRIVPAALARVTDLQLQGWALLRF